MKVMVWHSKITSLWLHLSLCLFWFCEKGQHWNVLPLVFCGVSLHGYIDICLAAEIFVCLALSEVWSRPLWQGYQKNCLVILTFTLWCSTRSSKCGVGNLSAPCMLFILKAIGISRSLFLHLLFCGILALNYASFASVSSTCNFHFFCVNPCWQVSPQYHMLLDSFSSLSKE
jgi:hypothetical protein